MKFARYAPWARVGSHIWLWVLALIIIAPLAWLTMSVFKDSSAIVGDPFALPRSFSLQNIVDAWTTGGFAQLYVNSILITTVSVLGILLLEGLAAYAFSRLRFPGRDIWFVIFLAGQFVPAQIVAIPSFLQINALGLGDTQMALILQYLSWAPFAVLFLRASMMAVPRELEEAMMIDGANRLRILFQLILPMCRSAFATVGTIYALWIYNDFLFPLIYIRSPENATVPLGLAQFQGLFTTFWGYLIGAIVIAVWPPLIVYGLLSRQISSRFAAGGVKA
ncbi:carbohydrate ABC transporter permease [uncultured Amnibacterium sp.]|uniref:carbohydrate ABC transporter permease n=1 Tax=uncultured Amnibacterium sp. TaxID=1631851 RepID=UPI0035CAD58A